MANDRKREVEGPVRRDPTPEADERAPTRRHPLFGALKGFTRMMPGTDLTRPVDPAWGDDDPPKM